MRRIVRRAPRRKPHVHAQTMSSERSRPLTSCRCELSLFVQGAAKTLLFLITTLGAGRPDHGRFRYPSHLPGMDGHGPRVTFWTCDQQLIRLHWC